MRTVIIGGFVDYQIQLSKALNKSGDSLVVIYSMSRRLPEENLRIGGDSVRLWLLAREGPIYNPVVLFRFLRDCSRTLGEIRRFRPDVVHFQIGSAMLAFLMPFLRAYPIVTTFHDVAPHSGEEKAWERYIHEYIRKKSCQLLVHGEKLKQLLVREYGVPAEKANSIPIGPHNIDAFLMHRRRDLKEEGPVVMFFGRILEYKGLEYLIRAEPLITAAIPNARIVIAGAGNDMDRYEAMMANRDRFLLYKHHIPYDEGAILFQRSSVIALPYIEASQSGVVSTAYGFDKPVVVTDVGSIPEIVDDGVTGLIVPPRDHVALAEAIIRLLKDPELAKRMGENGHRKLYTDLSWDNVVRRTMVVYERAVELFDGSKHRTDDASAGACPETPDPVR
jgi:glycosyltransferase involved in cell wall biosynthesis